MSEDNSQKDIQYKIVMPVDKTVTGDQVLDDEKIKVRTGGYPGENLIFWLVAIWDEDTAYLGNIEWGSHIFATEITNIEYDNYPTNISSNEIEPSKPAVDSVVRKLCAAVPLVVKLPIRPASSATLSIWKDEFSTLLFETKITVALPVNYVTNFSVERDYIKIALDFSSSSCQINSFDLHYTPQEKNTINDYDKAFALQKDPKDSAYILSFASNNALQLLRAMYLGLAVIWDDSKMMSHFIIEIPLPACYVGMQWHIPPLERLKQANISAEITNLANEVIHPDLEISNNILIPLVKTLEIKDLKVGETRTINIPVVPKLEGLHELNYKVKVKNSWFKPLFKTIINIA